MWRSPTHHATIGLSAILRLFLWWNFARFCPSTASCLHPLTVQSLRFCCRGGHLVSVGAGSHLMPKSTPGITQPNYSFILNATHALSPSGLTTGAPLRRGLFKGMSTLTLRKRACSELKALASTYRTFPRPPPISFPVCSPSYPSATSSIPRGDYRNSMGHSQPPT